MTWGSKDLDIDDFSLKCRAAQTMELKMDYARKVIRLRFERGDFPIEVLDAALLECMARKAIEEMSNE